MSRPESGGRGVFWAQCVDWVGRADIAILDYSDALGSAERLGRHFQGDLLVCRTQG
jgi:hypothetical protein